MCMFKKQSIRLLLPLFVVLFVSCTDLETSPRQSLTPDIVLTDLSGFESLAFSMYNRATGFNYYGQAMMVAPEVLADNLRILANTGRYVGEEANADREHIDIWNGNVWGGINDANMIINRSEERRVGKEGRARRTSHHTREKTPGNKLNSAQT